MDILDSDILIDVQHGHPPALAWFTNLVELPSVPGYVVMELVQDARNQKEVGNALKLAAPLPTVWPSAADCNRALSDFSMFHRSHGLGLIDSLIAACVIGLSGTLCTFNDKHYRAIPGLTIRQPYSR